MSSAMPRRRSSSRSRSNSSSSSSCSSSRSSSGHDRHASGSQGGGSGRNRYQSHPGRHESSTKKAKKRSRTRDARSSEDRRRRKSSNKSKKDHNHHQRRRHRRHGSRRRSTTRSRSRSRSASPPKKSRKDRRRSRSRSRDRRRRSPDRRTADRPSPSTTRVSLEVSDRPVTPPVASEISKPEVDAHETAIQQTRRERAIANIESSSGFAPASFVSSAKSKVASIALPGEAPPAMTSGFEFGTAFEKNELAPDSGPRLLDQMTADGLCHPSLFGCEAEKEARWVRHLFQLRKNLMQTGL